MSSDPLVSSQRGAEHLFVWQHLLSAQLCRFFWHAQSHYSLMPCPFQRSFLPGLFQHVSSGSWMHLDCHSPSLMPSQVLKCRPFLESIPVECPQLGTRSPGCNPARDRTPMLLTSPTLSMHQFSPEPLAGFAIPNAAHTCLKRCRLRKSPLLIEPFKIHSFELCTTTAQPTLGRAFGMQAGGIRVCSTNFHLQLLSKEKLKSRSDPTGWVAAAWSKYK